MQPLNAPQQARSPTKTVDEVSLVLQRTKRGAAIFHGLTQATTNRAATRLAEDTR
jgi:hypothetical protein